VISEHLIIISGKALSVIVKDQSDIHFQSDFPIPSMALAVVI